MPDTIPLGYLNTLNEADFTRALEGIFEHSPWVATRTHAHAPFESLNDLHAKLSQTVKNASPDEQLALLRAHPDLAGKAALAGNLTQHSSAEQAGAGLNALTAEEHARFHALNNAYKQTFGFPFILAVKGHDKHSILSAFELRLQHTKEKEQATALTQVFLIARYRLEELIRE